MLVRCDVCTGVDGLLIYLIAIAIAIVIHLIVMMNDHNGLVIGCDEELRLGRVCRSLL